MIYAMNVLSSKIISTNIKAGQMTREKDIVLIYFEDEPLVHARIEDITADVKKGWFVVRLLLLQVPLEVTSWILREQYINGDEFTMNGKKVRLEKIVCPEEHVYREEDEKISEESKPDGSKGQVISLKDRIKK